MTLLKLYPEYSRKTKKILFNFTNVKKDFYNHIVKKMVNGPQDFRYTLQSGLPKFLGGPNLMFGDGQWVADYTCTFTFFKL